MCVKQQRHDISTGLAEHVWLASPWTVSLISSNCRQQGSACREPKQRPTIGAVAAHPCWWPPRTKLQFLIDTSDAFELCDRASDQTELRDLEGTAAAAFPPGTNWAASLEETLIGNLYQYRSYKYSSLRDLLRVIRNKCNHFREMPAELQALIGAPPDNYFRYCAYNEGD